MIHELFESQVERSPEDVAVIFEDSQLTYRELNDRAERLAQQLKTMGVGPDVLVALLLDRSLDMVVGMLGILKAGGAYIPLDPSHPGNRIVSVLEDAQPLLLLTDARLKATLPPHRTPAVPIDFIAPANIREAVTQRASSPSNLAYVIFTSGSTGRPKGVEIEHRSVTNFLASMKRQPGLCAGDTMLAITTLSFDIAVLEIFLPLVCGACVVIASTETTRDGAALAELIQRRGVSVLQATPSTLRMLVDAGWMGAPELKILCGGEAWSTELANLLLARCGSLWNMYGPTETTVWSAIAKVEAGRPITIGAPVANTRLYVLDRALQLVPIGVPGELFIAGAGLARGYLHQPDLTRERFVPDPYGQSGTRMYRTGDLVRRLADGTLEFLGRLDHQVKIRGHRIELGEIEAALQRHRDVKQCAVIASQDSAGEHRLVAYVIPNSDAVAAAGELRGWLSEALPSYMIPSAYVSLSSFPLTPNGKLDRKALPSPDRATPEDVALLVPRNEVEEILAQLWREMLDINEVGVRDNFFDLGGNSVLAARTVARINQRFGTKLNAGTIFRTPTIETLTAVVGQSQLLDQNDSRVVPFRKGNRGVPLYFIGAGPVEYRIAQLLSEDRDISAVDVTIPAEWRRTIDAMDQSAPPTLEKLGELYGKALFAHIGSSPCVIAGYSFSGKVAFEAARAIKRAGGDVVLVLLIDAYAWFGLTYGTMSQIWSSIWRKASDGGENNGSHAWKVVTSLRKSAQLLCWLVLQAPRVVGARVWKNRRPSSMVDSAGVPIDQSTLNSISRIVGRSYRPQSVDAHAVLLRAKLPNEEMLSEVDPTNGWHDLFAQGLEVIQAKGNHWSIVGNEQNVVALAEQVNAVLNRCDFGSAGRDHLGANLRAPAVPSPVAVLPTGARC
jgi:amino acid adenylation domain-containing protein